MSGYEFTHQTLGQRVRFGRGQVGQHVAEEVKGHDATKVMLISSEREAPQASQATELIDIALNWAEVTQHVPVDLARRATLAARESGVDLILSVGGGSTTGLAKAIALETAIPVVAVPTTYAGSEATNMWGMTEEATKSTGLDDKVLPRAVIYDAELVATLPMGLAVASALNAMAHCVDSLWAPKADPINQVNALEGARALASALRRIHADPDDVEARGEAFYGCYLAAVSFASAGSGLHHKICHILGGTFNLPHAETHATVLPHVLAFNAPAVPELGERLARALSGGDSHPGGAVGALADLYREVEAPGALAEVGFTAEGIPEAVRRTLAVVPASNPVTATEENITQLLTNALEGEFATRKA
ncbi:Maleylacetate reductase [Corynebacterium occultum]|uniref:Maleylacetate reductase n=1 Tax=Corynebacterium occultum TaxID=2675219 RepID=A0A6B8VXL7_9CORY|nr:maleylacetate reductase [Corynebacterium occultum]QGU06084.1 Maleylacetate reductase [Corynebacterium occultum]